VVLKEGGMLKAAVSGSFHRHMAAVYIAVGELRALGVDVLSPSDPRIVDHVGEFLFVASDRLRSIKLVQDRHFEAIRTSDFLWLVCPDGYVGLSASAEIGAAHAMGIPVFADHLPLDITLQHYVRKVGSIRALVDGIKARSRGGPDMRKPHFLLDPDLAIDESIRALEHLKPIMRGLIVPAGDAADKEVAQVRNLLQQSFGQPTKN
jgi:hypothetical protein